MTKRKLLVFLLLLMAFTLSFYILMFDIFREEVPPQIYNISVIVRGKNSDSWANIKQGADQAASEMNVELSFITLTEENELAEQSALLQREYESGVDAVVISAADSEGLKDPVEKIAQNIPVICIESPVDSDAVASYISSDNFDMGVQLGKEIVSSGNARKRLALVTSSPACQNIQQRRAGLMSVLEPIGGETLQWDLSNNAAEAAQQLESRLREKNVDVVVTVDTYALELVAQAALEEQAAYLDLFGIGASGKVASFIEQDIVTATVVQNDFGIGYLGIKAAVDAIRKLPTAPTIEVEHRLVNWRNMYDLENQRLLFPFIR